MTIQELYDKLNSPGFQDPEQGDLFYNYFIFQYPAEDEYAIREQIEELGKELIRPAGRVDVLTMNLFEEFCTYLDRKPFMKHPSMLRYLLDKEQADPSQAPKVRDMLAREAQSDGFMQFLRRRIIDHVSVEDNRRRPYVFLCGVGSIFPYLRVNELLTRYEKYNDTSRYKIIVFYPGRREDNSFSLFGMLSDNHTYRATLLVNE